MSLSLVVRLARRERAALSSLCPRPRHVSPSACRSSPALASRAYASKSESKTKIKSTASFVPGSQLLFDSQEARAEYDKAKARMAAAVDWLRKEVAAMETRAAGRITPAVLSPVRVDVRRAGRAGRDGPVRLEEVATVGVKDGSVLIVTVFDEQNMKAVEQGIYDAKLSHIVPQRLDARTFKIPVPKPTVEARKMLFTTASRTAEDVRVQIRKHHQTSVRKGKYGKHSLELEEFQKLSDRHISEVDRILAQMKNATGSK